MLKFYDPTVSFSTIYFPRNGKAPYLRYNHCVDIIHFKDRYVAAWNANRTGSEGVPGQYNFISTSPDFKRWSPAEKLFGPEHCDEPVLSDRQWQPSFLQFNGTLFVAWCDTVTRTTYVASSQDAEKFRNRVVAAAGLPEGTVAFPTNHGLAEGDGTLFFPASLPEKMDGQCRYAIVLISRDGGRNWHWSRPVEAAPWSSFGVMPEKFPLDRPTLWEPMVYRAAPGKLGMLIRNNTPTAENPSIQPEHLLLYAESDDDGETWSDARPVEVETIVSRCYAESLGGPMLMAMNDWPRGVPEHISYDRYHLSLFFSPTGDPDLLLPGPEIQPDGGRAFYPNGFTENGKLYVAYTYPDFIGASVVEKLPDFRQPFMMLRKSRPGVRYENGTLTLSRIEGAAPVLPTPGMVKSGQVTLQFSARAEVRTESDFPLLTLGGKTRNGAILMLRFDPEADCDRCILRSTSGREMELGTLALHEDEPFQIRLARGKCDVAFRNNTATLEEDILFKIAFGGLYSPVIWPQGSQTVQNCVRIHDIDCR